MPLIDIQGLGFSYPSGAFSLNVPELQLDAGEPDAAEGLLTGTGLVTAMVSLSMRLQPACLTGLLMRQWVRRFSILAIRAT